MKYGLPYKGSKNKLALRINQLLPKADHLIDLFCGGCAVTHAALTMDKFQHIHINDVDWRPVQLFTDSLAGKYENENRWISREDFFRLKDVDPYVAIVWSFGNDMRTYMYGREIEEIKRSLHYAIYFADYAPAKALGYDLSFLDGIHGFYKRYITTKKYFQDFYANHIDEIGNFTPPQNTSVGLESLERTKRLRIFQVAEPRKTWLSTPPRVFELQHCESGTKLSRWGEYLSDRAFHLQSFEATRRLQKKRTDRLTYSVLDYQAVPIPENSVIYCDMPYKGTSEYNLKEKFDHERFYDWCAKQTQPVFISSYDMPEDKFTCIACFEHSGIFAVGINSKVEERIFIPKHQTYKPPFRNLEIF